MRETSFISSSGCGSPEYKRIQQLTRELSNAIQYDLQDITDHLWSCDNMITEQNYQYFTKKCIPECERAGKLVQVVLNRIKLDSRYYCRFIQVLEKNKEYYSSILQKIHEYSHDDSLQQRPLSSTFQHHSDEESQSEEDESSDDEQAPQEQCKGETPPKPEQERVNCAGPYCPSSVCGCLWAIICCPIGIILYLVIHGIVRSIFFPLSLCRNKTIPYTFCNYVFSLICLITILSLFLYFFCQSIPVRSSHAYIKFLYM